jgi:hypothetical protein
MFGEDMQSDQLRVPAIGTVDFCFSMMLFAVRSLTFHPVWFGQVFHLHILKASITSTF